MSGSDMQLTAVRPTLKSHRHKILRAEVVKIVLWSDAVAQFEACSSFIMKT